MTTILHKALYKLQNTSLHNKQIATNENYPAFLGSVSKAKR